MTVFPSLARHCNLQRWGGLPVFQTLLITTDLLRMSLLQCLQALLQVHPVRLRLL